MIIFIETSRSKPPGFPAGRNELEFIFFRSILLLPGGNNKPPFSGGLHSCGSYWKHFCDNLQFLNSPIKKQEKMIEISEHLLYNYTVKQSLSA
jgi:hypothetical protein